MSGPIIGAVLLLVPFVVLALEVRSEKKDREVTR